MYYIYGCVCLRETGKIWRSLKTIFIFYQYIFKLVTKELSSLVIRDLLAKDTRPAAYFISSLRLSSLFGHCIASIQTTPWRGLSLWQILILKFLSLFYGFCRVLKYLHIVSSMISLPPFWPVVYSLLLWPFCTLEHITSSDFLLYVCSNAWPVKYLVNHHLRSIQSWMKEIRVVPFHYVFLDFLWNDYFIFVHYKSYIIPSSAKRTLFIFCRINFFQ